MTVTEDTVSALTPLLLFKSLSDQTRLGCVLLIAKEGSLCVCELEHALDEEQPKISRHLALLRRDGIVETERRGKWVHYRIHPELGAWAKDIIQLAAQHHQAMLAPLLDNLTGMSDRPQRCC